MAHYIDKDALVAEIERRTDDLYDYLPDASKVENGTITISEACNTGKYTSLESFRNYIDTIVVTDGIAADIEVKVDAGGYPYIPQIELYDYEKDIPLAKAGDKVKVIIMAK